MQINFTDKMQGSGTAKPSSAAAAGTIMDSKVQQFVLQKLRSQYRRVSGRRIRLQLTLHSGDFGAGIAMMDTVEEINCWQRRATSGKSGSTLGGDRKTAVEI